MCTSGFKFLHPTWWSCKLHLDWPPSLLPQIKLIEQLLKIRFSMREEKHSAFSSWDENSPLVSNCAHRSFCTKVDLHAVEPWGGSWRWNVLLVCKWSYKVIKVLVSPSPKASNAGKWLLIHEPYKEKHYVIVIYKNNLKITWTFLDF